MNSSYKRENSNDDLNIVIKLIIGIRLLLEDIIYSSARFVIDAPRFLIYISNSSLVKFIVAVNVQYAVFIVITFLLRGIGFINPYDLYFNPLELFIPAILNLLLFFILKLNPSQKEDLNEISYDEFQKVKQGYYGEYEEDDSDESVDEEVEYREKSQNYESDVVWVDDIADDITEIVDESNNESNVSNSFYPNYEDLFGEGSDDLEIIPGITLEDEIVVDLSDSMASVSGQDEVVTSTEQKIDYVQQVTSTNIDNILESLTPMSSEGIPLGAPSNANLPVYDTSSIENTQSVIEDLVTNGYSYGIDYSDEKLNKLQEKFKRNENEKSKKYLYEGVEVVSPSQRKLNSALEKMNAYFT